VALIKRGDQSTYIREATVLNLADIRAQARMVEEQAASRAADILRLAHGERERLIAGAREIGLAEGTRRGVEEGKAQGAAEAKSVALGEMRSKLGDIESKWMAALAEFEAARDTMLAEARKDLIRLSIRIAEAVLKKAVESDTGIAMRQLDAALELLTRPSRLTVAVNPTDEPMLRESLPHLMTKCQKAEHIQLVVDPGLARGSCKVRTAGGEIDAGIWTQVERIGAALLNGGGSDEASRTQDENSGNVDTEPRGEA